MANRGAIPAIQLPVRTQHALLQWLSAKRRRHKTGSLFCENNAAARRFLRSMSQCRLSGRPRDSAHIVGCSGHCSTGVRAWQPCSCRILLLISWFPLATTTTTTTPTRGMMQSTRSDLNRIPHAQREHEHERQRNQPPTCADRNGRCTHAHAHLCCIRAWNMAALNAGILLENGRACETCGLASSAAAAAAAAPTLSTMS